MQHRRRRRRRYQEGMTLIEVMVVLVIMTSIAAAAAIGVMRSLAEARKRDTMARARTIQTAVFHRLIDQEEECPQVADLERAQVLEATTQHTDAWGHAFAVACEENTVHVKSSGPDGQFGNSDDIGF